MPRQSEHPLKVMLTFTCASCKRPLECEDRSHFSDDEDTDFKIEPCDHCLDEARKEGATNAH